MKSNLSQLRAAFDCNPVGTLIVDHKTRMIIDFNKSFLAMWNIPQKLADIADDNALIQHVLNQVSDTEGFISLIEDLYKTPHKKSRDYISFQDGRKIERTSEPCIVDGEIMARAWFFNDVSDYEKIKESLEFEKENYLKKSQFFKTTLDSVPLLIARVDINKKYLFVNLAYMIWFNKSEDQILGKTMEEVLGPKNYARVSLRVEDVLRGKECEFEFNADFDGKNRTVLGSYVPIKNPDGSINGFHIVITDISRIRELEGDALNKKLMLQELYERHAITFSALRYGTWDFNYKTNTLFWDDYMYSVYGVNKDDYASAADCYSKTMLVGEAESIRLQTEKCRSERNPELKATYKINSPKGIRHINFCGRCFYDDKGNIERVVGASWDVTENIQRAIELDSSQKLLRQIVDFSPDWIFVKDRDHRYLLVNKTYADTLSRNPKDFIGKDDIEMGFPEEIVKGNHAKGITGFWDSDNMIFETGRLHVIPNDPAIVNGKTLHLHTVKAPLFDENKKVYGVLGWSRDLTLLHEKDKLLADQQASLVSASKMSSLGEMAGGIAHEINTPLAIIIGYATHVRMKINSAEFNLEKVNEDLQKIEDTSLRIGRIIKGLRSFSRNSENDPMEEVGFSQILEDTLALCHERFKSHSIELLVKVEDGILKCRPTQISQVLMNLIGNAFDAVEELPNKWVRIEAKPLGNDFLITVTDSGPGIPPKVAEQMMNPFFTTKEVGKGTGLGLSISQGIIGDHQGVLSYVSLGPNTQFQIKLPLVISKITSKVA